LTAKWLCKNWKCAIQHIKNNFNIAALRKIRYFVPSVGLNQSTTELVIPQDAASTKN